jgi:zinc protease
MPSPIREAYLDNGLKVILKEVHTAPVTSTWLWYRVGSRDEVEGCTGLSHWVEHMMFKGSSQFPKGAIMRAVDREGGYLNAMTSYDFTTYYTTLPSDRAELALRIEADRMTSASFAQMRWMLSAPSLSPSAKVQRMSRVMCWPRK